MNKNPSAAILIIGNEILSGRTLDTNTQNIATSLGKVGVIVCETRTAPDEKQVIIKSVLDLSAKYDYVFTTGGIGPTHDDVTSLAISEAFAVPCTRNEIIYQGLQEYCKENGQHMNKAREKMAFIPEGSTLIPNNVTKVPGFFIKNVYCLAGVPEIMESMLNLVIPFLKHGAVIKTLSHTVMIGESKIAEQFEILQNKYPSVDMGSYPFTKDGIHGTSLVLRSNNYPDLEKAFHDLTHSF
ncbi:MAG: competence/damage-inducible protein A [Rickettsiaceae bacterium]